MSGGFAHCDHACRHTPPQSDTSSPTEEHSLITREEAAQKRRRGRRWKETKWAWGWAGIPVSKLRQPAPYCILTPHTREREEEERRAWMHVQTWKHFTHCHCYLGHFLSTPFIPNKSITVCTFAPCAGCNVDVQWRCCRKRLRGATVFMDSALPNCASQQQSLTPTDMILHFEPLAGRRPLLSWDGRKRWQRCSGSVPPTLRLPPRVNTVVSTLTLSLHCELPAHCRKAWRVNQKSPLKNNNILHVLEWQLGTDSSPLQAANSSGGGGGGAEE